MSIPTPFNPLGTLGASERRPFPMVRLTSNTEGSTLDGGPLPEGFKVDGINSTGQELISAWRALDGDVSQRCGQFGVGNFWMVDFGRKVELTKLTVVWSIANAGRHLELQCGEYVDGEVVWNEVPVYTFVSTIGNVNMTQECEITGIKAQYWRLYRPAGESNQTNLNEIEYTAFY